MKLSRESESRLGRVHPALAAVIRKAAENCKTEFRITEGIRSVQRQKELYRAGATKTLNSRHLTGHAVDVAAEVNGKVRWDWPLYTRIALCVKTASIELGIPIVWGGDWPSFPDGPHFELPRSKYP